MFTDRQSPAHHQYTLDLQQEVLPLTPGHLRLGGIAPRGEKIAFTNYYMTYNDRPCIPVMGEFHSARYPRQYWRQELQKMQAGGVTIVASYIFWIYVEEDEGNFDWSEDRDVRSFIEICRELGLHVVLRIGPFAHGECRNGGLPDWLYGRPFAVRSNDERYLAYVQRFYNAIGAQVAGLFFKDGGPILGIQIENEYMHCGAPWEVTFKQGSEWIPAGSDGEEHMLRLKQLAIEAGLVAPIYSCTGWLGSPVPEGEFLPMQGGYAFTPWIPDPDFVQEPTREFLFRNRHRQPLPNGDVTYDATQYPYVSCELGGGIQITYHHRPVVPPECVQAMAIVALGSGANLLGYYMYHGGSNPAGKHTFLNEFSVPRVSYDFQAPIREYGQLNPSYHRLRALHLFLQAFGEVLAPMMVALPEQSVQITPENTETLRYAARSKDGSGFLFLNNYQDHVEMRDHEDVYIQLALPNETLSLPHTQGLTLRQGVSTILPFNLCLADSVLLKYATAQVLTTLHAPEQTTYVFFAPDGIHTEFALDRTSYQSIEVRNGDYEEDDELCYVVVKPGLQSSIRLKTLSDATIQVLILTQEQAHACWKVQLCGQERLVLSDGLVLENDGALHLSWEDRKAIRVAIYPPLEDDLTVTGGHLSRIADSFFTQYVLTVPGYRYDLAIQPMSADNVSVRIPAMVLDDIGVQDIFLRIDYLGDMGHAYLDGRLVSDHFSNGQPWEIGLKRFIALSEDKDLLLHFSPLQQGAKNLRYFPTGMAFRPATDSDAICEIRSIRAVPEYHAVLTRSSV